MKSFFIHDDAKADLLEILRADPVAGGRIAAVLEEFESDPGLLEILTDHDHCAYESADVHISKWLEQWNKGRDLWRMKIWALEHRNQRYRIIYAYVIRTRRYYVLAVANRDFDYDDDHPISRRILAAYEDL